VAIFLLVKLYRATEESTGGGESWKFQDVHDDGGVGESAEVLIELEDGLKKA